MSYNTPDITFCPGAISGTVHATDDTDVCHSDNDNTWIRQLTNELIDTAGRMNTLESRFIELITEYDEYELWRVGSPGIKNFSNWLNVYCGIHPLVAREKIRVARCLRQLPDIREAFAAGVISYSKVRALTRVATPENESMLLEEAREMTAAQLEQRVRRFRKVEDTATDKSPYLKCWQDDDGLFHLHARLAPEDGVLVENAIERMMNTGGGPLNALPATYVQEEVELEVETGAAGKNVSAETFSDGGFGSRRARALTHIIEHFLATSKTAIEGRSGGDKTHVVVHINANATHRDCRINHGACTYLDSRGGAEFLAPDVARRLACDASITTALEDDNGNVLNIGRRSRLVTRAIDLAVDIRDNVTCQHPWCHQTRHTQKHHIKHWADGGETSVRNLVTLCQRHHTLVHEGEFRIVTIEDSEDAYHFEFVDRHGAIIEAVSDGPPLPDQKDAAQERVPAAELDASVIVGRELSPFERRVDRHRQQLAALRDFYSVSEPAGLPYLRTACATM